MIKITEHSGYREGSYIELPENYCTILKNSSFNKYFNRRREEQLCFSIKHHEDKKYRIESSYMIGVDWILQNELPIYVQPKLNSETKEIDYLKMLFEALQDSQNFSHLDDLYMIDFKAPLIEIEQEQDKLTPLLLIEFLQLLKQIVRKGLKKSYYKVTKNLNSRVKGKILVNATVKQNHTKQKMLYNVCQYEEFGYNSIENRILKKALLFTQSALSNLKGTTDLDIKHIFHFVSPAFQKVNEQIDIRALKNSKPNPLFKEYTQALRLAKLILKKYGYNIAKTTEYKIMTPPFWIDMTKLFELYVFKKLREVYPDKNEVKHHYTTAHQELDYLINARQKNCKMVVDAKYKDRYLKGNISNDDARQVSGYSRLKLIYTELGMKDSNELIDCLIIYPDQNINDDLSFEELFSNTMQSDDRYAKLFKLGIRLPEVSYNKVDELEIL